MAENENTLIKTSITLAQMNVTLKNVEHRPTNVERSLTKLEILEGRVIEIESSQQFLSTKYDELNNKSTDIDKENKQIDKENKLLLSKINSLEKKLEEERHKRISLEQYGRREMLEISGIQEQEGEDCIEIAHRICKSAKANIPIRKIIHRIMNGSIIVKFRDRPLRDLLFKNKLLLMSCDMKVHQRPYTSTNPWLLIRGSYYMKSKQNVGQSGTKGLSQTMG